MKNPEINEFLLKIADDAFIFGHRNSEWTGLGPTIEEDIAFSSMAQDKIGLAAALYEILHTNCNQKSANELAYNRLDFEFKNCQLVELQSQAYDISLIRHFLFDTAEYHRYTALQNSSFEPLKQLAIKVKGEIKYHLFHANTWVQQLSNSSNETKQKLQIALNQLLPYALGIFEPSEFEADLINNKIFIGENTLKNTWWQSIKNTCQALNLNLPEQNTITPIYGGRKGKHTQNLNNLLSELKEVYLFDTAAEW